MYSIGAQSKTLTFLGDEGMEEGLLKDCEGVMAQVRVVEVTKGPKKLHFLMFYGTMRALELDPKASSWKGRETLLSYNTTLGREMFRSSTPKANIVMKKWAKLLPSNFKLRWSNIWDKHCSKKEVGFIWTIWYKEVEVNVWRAIVDGSINKIYLLCELCK